MDRAVDTAPQVSTKMRVNLFWLGRPQRCGCPCC
jgi:hypothetical protein